MQPLAGIVGPAADITWSFLSLSSSTDSIDTWVVSSSIAGPRVILERFGDVSGVKSFHYLCCAQISFWQQGRKNISEDCRTALTHRLTLLDYAIVRREHNCQLCHQHGKPRSGPLCQAILMFSCLCICLDSWIFKSYSLWESLCPPSVCWIFETCSLWHSLCPPSVCFGYIPS